MYNFSKYIFAAILITTVLFSFGCDTNDGNDTGFGTMEVWLHDEPADFEEVQIFVERVEVNRHEDSDEGWVVINEPEQLFDLLTLTNGEYEVLGSAELEEGTYSQIRLIVNDDKSYVMENGEEKSLFVPSGAQTGVKLNIHAEISEGVNYILLLDFDVKHSIVQPGASGQPADYLLKPVIRTASLSETGSIMGVISPAEANAIVSALDDGEVVSTTFSDKESGEFLLWLEEGTYTITVESAEEGFDTYTIEDASVTAGEDTDLGGIELESSE